MNKEKSTYMHIDIGTGKVTLAVKVSNNIVRVGAAFCSPNDQFSRKKGRLIADGRIDVDKCLYEFNADSSRKIKEQVRSELANSVYEGDCRLPTWACA